MNAILLQKALAKVPNRHVRINIISCRVRQLNSGMGSERRPLIVDGGNLSAADTALLEIIEDRMTFEMPEVIALKRPTQNGKRPKGWAPLQAS